MKPHLLINMGLGSNLTFVNAEGRCHSYKEPGDEVFPAKALERLLAEVGLRYIMYSAIRVAYEDDRQVTNRWIAMLYSLSEDVMYTNKIIPLRVGLDLYSTNFFFFHNRPYQCENHQLSLLFPEAASPEKQQ